MGDLRRRNGGGGGSQSNQDKHHSLFPKPESLDFDHRENAASVSHVKSLLIEMGFCSSLAQKAIDENGKDVPVDEMVDYIVAAQLAQKYAQDSQDLSDGPETKSEDDDVVLSTEVPSELPFDKMDKTSQLLEMGFSHHEISVAIEKIGKEAQISDLAESIITGEVPADFADDSEDIEKKVSTVPETTPPCPSKSWRFVGVAAQKMDGDGGSSSGTAKVGERSVRKRIKVEDDRDTDFVDKGKRLRPSFMGGSRSVMETPGMQEESSNDFTSALQPRLSQTLPSDAATRPYIFYGNIGELSPQWWSKISNFFIGIHQEHVDTRLCSALDRKEDYMHNLPTENRFHILPKPSRSGPSIISPENLECIMGYPPNHTNIGGGRSAERLKLLDYCFQTDTLGYHLSVLKPMFPQGLTVLSLFSGIGGAEIALSRLGIHLKGVYSVEPCGLSRNILKRWWQTSGQTGELVQIEDIRRLRIKMVETLVQSFGGFDLVICQNPPAPADVSKESSRSEACKFDYMLFNEFVRVSKSVKALMQSS